WDMTLWMAKMLWLALSMVRDILSIPISTEASESTFSVGGRVLDQFHSSFKPECVEALVCTRDLLFENQDNYLN
ncbi:Dimer_Tnp_hAT domain-containing protein, partial [Cephalotus follicularis]